MTLLEEWTNKKFSEGRQQELEQFTEKTQGSKSGSFHLRSPHGKSWLCGKSYFGTGASGPDVYGIDVIWPRILYERGFYDLKPYFANEISAQFPALAASYTVDNKLVAMAYRADIGLLFYRTDLLRQYEYSEPPSTWDELETMAARIQAGERRKVRRSFGAFCGRGPLPKR